MPNAADSVLLSAVLLLTAVSTFELIERRMDHERLTNGYGCVVFWSGGEEERAGTSSGVETWVPLISNLSV